MILQTYNVLKPYLGLFPLLLGSVATITYCTYQDTNSARQYITENCEPVLNADNKPTGSFLCSTSSEN